MPKASKTKSTSRKVVQTTRGPRDIVQAQADLRVRRKAMIESSIVIEREVLREHGVPTLSPPPPPTSRSGAVGMDAVDSMDVVENDDDGDWVTDVGDKPDEIYRELEDSIRDMESNHVHYIKTSDIRDRHDRLERQNAAWALILPLLVDAHLQWEHTGPPKVIPEVEVHSTILVIDLFESQDVMFPLDDQTPNLSIQAFVKGVCDLHRVPYKSSLRTQISSTFDVYLEVC
ncbi:hypothetical protein BU17DRAFT_65177 [Hysterangium stoloniferum]|nr:hypothetical protein BU17DRAFT_65177 [Hysterangium stoloniferum]